MKRQPLKHASPVNLATHPDNFFAKYRNSLTLSFLLILTTISAALGEFSQLSTDFTALILIILVLKAQLIIDYFMQLKSCKLFWRATMSSFALVIALIIWICN